MFIINFTIWIIIYLIPQIMSYTIDYDKKMNIVVLKHHGIAVPEDHYNAKNEVQRMCREKNCSRLLVDLRDLTGEKVTIIGCYEFGENLAEKLRNIKIANVLPEESAFTEEVSFISTVAVNRGVTIEVFKDADLALKWLMAEE